MTRSLCRLAGSAAVLPALLMAASASAQNASNEAWIGQVGTTNTVDIYQAGRNNMAGGSVRDGVDRQINQDGVDNRLSIEQFGFANAAGTMIFGTGPFLSGLNQIGDRNEIAINQSTGENAEDGSNTVGAVRQVSTSPLPGSTVTNQLTVTQSGTGLSGPAGHYVGSVVQEFTANDTAASNVATIQQSDGGLGVGNVLRTLRQRGVGNVFTLDQDGQLNQVRTAIQSGSGNESEIVQEQEGNRVELFRQYGSENSAIVHMKGVSNTIDQIYQDNRGWGVSGNIANVEIVGDGNGGMDVADSFYSTPAQQLGILQASLIQEGDQNDADITLVGDDNRFGSKQLGDGNSVSITIGRPGNEMIKANENDSAVFQEGAGNVFDHDVIGNRNVAAILEKGNNNRLNVVQRGDDNLSDIRIEGNLNNTFSVSLNPGFTVDSPAGAVALIGGLQPGLVSSTGLRNSVYTRVDGNSNNFGFLQDGDSNIVSSFITGGGNQLAVVQVGNSNMSLSVQTGSGNSLGVHQVR